MRSAAAVLLLLGCAGSAFPSPPRVRLGEPVLVVEGPAGEKRWGRYQFPRMHPTADGGVVVFVHVEADAAEAYGLPQRAFSSRDRGATWHPDPAAGAKAHGLRLPGGDWFLIRTPPAVSAAGLRLPAPAGETKNYGQVYTMFRVRELPENLRLIYFRRFPAGGREWRDESTPLNDPVALRYTVSGLLPRIWWGDIRVTGDKSLLAVVYPGYAEGAGGLYCHAVCYRSSDAGRNWKVKGRIPYQPDLQADRQGASRAGFTEPALEVLKDGSLLCVLRTDDGLGRGPLYLSRSRDAGTTWSRPVAFAPNGVMPRLLLLANGILVLSAGRPGLDLRFSFDGRGDTWSQPYPLVPLSAADSQTDSCGYSDLLPLDRNSFLVVYSWFKRPGPDGLARKSILVRRVAVGERDAQP